MIIDVTGVILTPGQNGVNCLGNGEHTDKNGQLIEYCCDECDYFLICFPALAKESKYTIALEQNKDGGLSL